MQSTTEFRTVVSQVLVSLPGDATSEQAFDLFVREIHVCWQTNDLARSSVGSPGTPAFEPNLGGWFAEAFPDGEIFEIGRVQVWHLGRAFDFHLAKGEVRN